MKNMLFILCLFLIVGIWQSGNAQKRYAILIAYDPLLMGDDNPNSNDPLMKDDRINEEIWNDTYAMWRTLVEGYGYDHENVYVAFRDGGEEYYYPAQWNAYNSNYWYDWGNEYYPITDIPMHKTEITSLFNNLANGTNGYPQITEDDFSFVQVFSWGAYQSFWTINGGRIFDWEFAEMLAPIQAHKKVVWLQFSFSGSFLNNCQANDTYVLASTPASNYSYAADDETVDGNYVMENEAYIDQYGNDFIKYHGEMNFHLFGALNGHSPGRPDDWVYDYYGEPYSNADENNDDAISLTEAYNWHYNHYSTGRWGEFPLVSDMGQMGLTTSLNYPTVINNYINDLSTVRGLACVTPGMKHVLPGTSIAIKENAKVDFIDDGWILLANNASLEFENNVELNTNSNLNIIQVYGTLTINGDFNSNVKIIVENNGELYLTNGATLNNANITVNHDGFVYLADDATFGHNSELTIYGDVRNCSGTGVRLTINGSFSLGGNSLITGLTSNGAGGVYIENNQDVVLRNVTFGHSDLYINLNYDNLSITNSSFNASKVDADIFTNQFAGNCTINNNVFTGAGYGGAVKIDGFNTFMITDNVFENNSGTGLAIYNSGRANYPNHHVNGNVFRNNNGYPITSYGVYVYQSVVNIGNNNKIYGNDIGLAFCHESTVSVYGDERLIERADFQEIYNNELYQVYAMDNSFPANFVANVIADGGDPNPMIYCTNTSAPRHDVENNCWGEAFNQTTDFYPPHGYDCFPKWNCGYDPSISLQIPEAKRMYDQSVEKMQDGDYATADGLLKEIVSAYPESPYAASAIKALPSVAIVEGNGFNDVIAYLQTDPTVTNNENLAKTAGYTIANCHIYAQNYSEALTFYEGIISNPPTYEDSVYAVVDAGRVALLMEEYSGKSGHTYKYPELVPESP